MTNTTKQTRLQPQVSNPVEHYIQVQLYDNDEWHTTSQRFALSEIAQAFVELGKWRVRYPDTKFRLVSIIVTLLSEETVSA